MDWFDIPTDTIYGNYQFGGLSGIDYDPVNDVYFPISDDRSQKGPARYYNLGISIDSNGINSISIDGSIEMLKKDGNIFGEKEVDPERCSV